MTLITLFGQSFEDSLLNMYRKTRIVLPGRYRCNSQVLERQREEIRGCKGGATCNEFIGNAAQRVLIALLTNDPLKLLWSHVQRRTDESNGFYTGGGKG